MNKDYVETVIGFYIALPLRSPIFVKSETWYYIFGKQLKTKLAAELRLIELGHTSEEAQNYLASLDRISRFEACKGFKFIL